MPDGPLVVPASHVRAGDYLHWGDELYRVLEVAQGKRHWLHAGSVDLVCANPHGGPDVVKHYWADDTVTVTRA